jgi:uncharacterized membrane protein YGL010W
MKSAYVKHQQTQQTQQHKNQNRVIVHPVEIPTFVAQMDVVLNQIGIVVKMVCIVLPIRMIAGAASHSCPATRVYQLQQRFDSNFGQIFKF